MGYGLNPDRPWLQNLWNDLYVEMLSDPSADTSDAKFCSEIKLELSTLQTWKRKYSKQIFEEVQRRRTQRLAQIRTIAWKHLMKKLEKDTNALKLAFQLLGDLVERSETKHDFMDRKDKEKRLQALFDELQNKKTNWDKAEQSQSDRQEPANGNNGQSGATPGENPTDTGKV